MDGRSIIKGAKYLLDNVVTPLSRRFQIYLLAITRSALNSRLMLTAPPQPLLLMPPPAASNTLTNPPVKLKKKPRKTTAYADNVTASVALSYRPMPVRDTSYLAMMRELIGRGQKQPIIDDIHPDIVNEMQTLEIKSKACINPDDYATQCAQQDDIILKKLEMVPGLIYAHAATRMDLLLYLFIAVHGTYLTYGRGDTDRQHGSGNNAADTHACHSSLFPHLSIEKSTMAPSPVSWFAALFTRVTNAITIEELEEAYLIKHANNITHELPAIVNGFDGHLEGRGQGTIYMREIVDLVNRVSHKKMNPHEGFSAAIKTMDAFFKHMEYDYVKKTRTLRDCPYPKSFKYVWECEKAGTFACAQAETLKIDAAYWKAMLRGLSCDALQKEILSANTKSTQTILAPKK